MVGKERAPTPFDGLPGFTARLNRFLFPLAGQAQIGTGAPEAPYVPPSDPLCPVCEEPMRQHRVERGDASTRTYLHCPARRL